MLKQILIALVLSTLSSATPAQSALDYPSVWKCDADKFHWYCDVEEAEKAPKNASQPSSAALQPRTKRLDLERIKTAEQLRQELKRREDVAVMNPTDQHLKDYLELWQFTQQKGAAFADNWRRVVWQNPALDYTLTRPANNAAIKVYDERRLQHEKQQLRLLAKKHGLIFFFRGDCPYCHAMAPTLKNLADTYGFDVLGVSLDGIGLAEFPNPSDGRPTAAAWGIVRVPALFIGSKETGARAPIGFGMLALSEIVNRIYVLTGTKPGDNF